MIIIKKDLFIILNNLEMLVDEYLNNLYFLNFFSENTKREIITFTKNYIKNMKIFQKNDETVNNIIKENRWKDYLSYYLKDSNSHSKSTIWEMFSINSFFLNITFCLLKFIEIEDKNSIIHKYIKFLVFLLYHNYCKERLLLSFFLLILNLQIRLNFHFSPIHEA